MRTTSSQSACCSATTFSRTLALRVFGEWSKLNACNSGYWMRTCRWLFPPGVLAASSASAWHRHALAVGTSSQRRGTPRGAR